MSSNSIPSDGAS